MAKRGRPPLAPEIRRNIIRLAREGKTWRQIHEELAVGERSVGRVLGPLGGVRRREQWQCSLFRLSLDDRIEIQLGLGEDQTFTSIATKLGRAVSTVSREVH